MYFSAKALPQGVLSDDQFARLQEVKRQFVSQGLLANYNNTEHLREQVQFHLTRVVMDLLAKDRPGLAQLSGPVATTLERPDIRVKIETLISAVTGQRPQKILGVKVENHSPMIVFLHNISLERRNSMELVPTRDMVTGEFQRRRELRPGESFTLHLIPEVLVREGVRSDELVCASVMDDIGRVYKSSEEEFRRTVTMVFERS